MYYIVHCKEYIFAKNYINPSYVPKTQKAINQPSNLKTHIKQSTYHQWNYK